MAATITFDTLKFVKRLKAAGFAEDQAEALSDAQKESLTEILDTIVRLEKEIVSVKSDIIKWVAVMLVAQAGVVATLVKLL